MRLFVAADIPEAQRASLHEALEPLKPLIPGVRWASPDSWHVTLKFLGELSEARLDEVQRVLEEVVSRAGPFETRLTEAGAFPSLHRPRVLWMGLADEALAFRNLAGRIRRKFDKIGFPAESRPLRPHLTLARVKRPLQEPDPPLWAQSLKDELSAGAVDRSVFEIGKVILFQSQLSSRGSRYKRVLELPLA